MALAGLPPIGGTYALVIRLNTSHRFTAGSLGPCHLPGGWHIYVGSAFGPGGLAARVGRHLRADKPKRWHIDYLTATFPVTRVWLSARPEHLECRWARHLMAMGGKLHLTGFGSSDCRCPAHLLSFRSKPRFRQFRSLAGGPVRSVIA